MSVEPREERLRMAAGVRHEMMAQARRAAPRECCGLLVGTPGRIERCVPTDNVDPHPSRYQVDPVRHISVNRELRGTGRSVVGVYHSHPRGPAQPSPADVAEAHYPEFVHVIVSGLDSEHPAIGAYRIIHGIIAEIRLEEEESGEPS